MRSLCFSTVAVLVCAGAAHAAEALPESGSAKLAAYQVCRSLAAVDMGLAGSQAATECTGILRNHDADKLPDNLALHCLEDTTARPDGYRYAGSCVATDSDGDKLYMTYEGTKSGAIKWVGGTGKYQEVAGSGSLSVLVAPGATGGQFAYTLNMDVNWSRKPK